MVCIRGLLSLLRSRFADSLVSGDGASRHGHIAQHKHPAAAASVRRPDGIIAGGITLPIKVRINLIAADHGILIIRRLDGHIGAGIQINAGSLGLVIAAGYVIIDHSVPDHRFLVTLDSVRNLCIICFSQNKCTTVEKYAGSPPGYLIVRYGSPIHIEGSTVSQINASALHAAGIIHIGIPGNGAAVHNKFRIIADIYSDTVGETSPGGKINRIIPDCRSLIHNQRSQHISAAAVIIYLP